MSDEVIYKFVRGQGWVPRTESDDFIEDFDKDVSDKVRDLFINAPRIGWTPEPILLIQREFEALRAAETNNFTVDRFVDCGVPNCEFCQVYRRER